MDYATESLKKHYEWRGKLEITPRAAVDSVEALSLAYTPGVAEACKVIQRNPDDSYNLTRRWNTVAVITDGTAVLGLGDIGGIAGMPVMEGKCVLFKAFGDVDAIPLCLNVTDTDQIVETIYRMSGSFGGINLEDISAPRCFEIEQRLIELCDIPIFHDDQHGTAIVTLAALYNALRLTGRDIGSQRCVIVGAGAAGVACAKLLQHAGIGDILLVDRQGVIHKGRGGLNGIKAEMAECTNRDNVQGSLSDAMKGADVLVGVSGPNLVTADMIRSMNPNPIVFAMSNPIPEIMPDVAYAAGAAVVGTGRSDFPNQINNVLAFPGVFRGVLDARKRYITTDMKVGAAKAIAALIADADLSRDYIIPSPFDPRVAPAVAAAMTL